MSIIDVKDSSSVEDYVPESGYSFLVKGQRTIVETYGWELQPSLAEELKRERQGEKPIRTIIVPLANYGDNPTTYSYKVTTWGYQFGSFRAIAEALGHKNYELYNQLVQRLLAYRY